LLERKKKDYPIVSWMDAEKKDISQPLTKREEKIPQPAHTNHEFFFVFHSQASSSSSSSRPKKEQNTRVLQQKKKREI